MCKPTLQAGAIHGGLMFTRSITNVSTKVRKQNWSQEVAIFASNFEFFNYIFSSVCKPTAELVTRGELLQIEDL